jgi:flavodoxin I
MKTLIVYDSIYGNTEKIAQAISSAMAGEVKLLRVSDANALFINEIDLLIIGSPTQGGKPTKSIQDFVDKISRLDIKDKNIVIFDTRISNKLVGIFGYAGGKISSSLANKGSNIKGAPEGFFVKGSKGPLKEGEIERAVNWARTII